MKPKKRKEREQSTQFVSIEEKQTRKELKDEDRFSQRTYSFPQWTNVQWNGLGRPHATQSDFYVFIFYFSWVRGLGRFKGEGGFRETQKLMGILYPYFKLCTMRSTHIRSIHPSLYACIYFRYRIVSSYPRHYTTTRFISSFQLPPFLPSFPVFPKPKSVICLSIISPIYRPFIQAST